MNREEGKLKKQLEKDYSSPIDQADIEAISKLIIVLQQEDKSIKLSSNFSDHIIQNVLQRKAKQNRFGWFGYFTGIVGLIAALFISLSLVEFKLDLGFLKGVSSYSGLFFFGVIFILILNIIEKRIIRFSS